jgi:hypothetical protein
VRIAVSVALIAPLAFAMGMPFPSAGGHRRRRQPALPWAGASTAASVVGAVLAALLAVHWGFNVLVGLAVALCLPAAGCFELQAGVIPILSCSHRWDPEFGGEFRDRLRDRVEGRYPHLASADARTRQSHSCGSSTRKGGPPCRCVDQEVVRDSVVVAALWEHRAAIPSAACGEAGVTGKRSGGSAAACRPSAIGHSRHACPRVLEEKRSAGFTASCPTANRDDPSVLFWSWPRAEAGSALGEPRCQTGLAPPQTSGPICARSVWAGW